MFRVQDSDRKAAAVPSAMTKLETSDSFVIFPIAPSRSSDKYMGLSQS